ncbi:MAG: hypothetical protein JNL70_04495 [Saprospiraceae bacterium]|nr:hypothetical protein [Saprospiraceae bacterium]
MIELEKYVQDRLSDELKIVREKFYYALNELTAEEKTIIYDYTQKDTTDMNQGLREKPERLTPFVRYLDFSLSKVQNSPREVVYRGVKLPETVLQKYLELYQKDEIIIEPAFLSFSRKRTIAKQFGEVIFEVSVIKGKAIESISYSPEEQEVLLRKGSKLSINGVEKQNNYTIVTATELA